MKKLAIIIMVLMVVSSLSFGSIITNTAKRKTTIVVAASDASASIKATADFICDGVADEVQINLALVSAALIISDTVELTTGTFSIDAIIKMLTSGLHLRGNGYGTVIVGSANLTLGSENNIEMGAVAGDPISGLRVSNLRINTIMTRGKYGVFAHSNVSDSQVDHNWITASFGGIIFTGGTNHIISHNTMLGVGDESIQVDGVTNSVIISNVIKENGQRSGFAGIRILKSSLIAVIGNSIFDCTSHGISSEGSALLTISGNVLRNNCTADTADHAEIRIVFNFGAVSGGGITISNNIIASNGADHGIREEANETIHHNIITNNQISGADASITISSETSQVYSNNTDKPYVEQRSIPLRNDGGNLVAGEIVVMKALFEDFDGTQFATSVTEGDDLVYGVLIEDTLDQATGLVMVAGKTTKLKVNGTDDIAILDFICVHTVGGIGQKAAVGNMAIAVALEAYTTDDSNGVIDALIITPRKL